MFYRFVILSFSIAGLSLAQDTPEKPAEAPVKPSVKQLDETRFELGTIIFDKQSREIRFPATVNMTQGALEYLIVHENGKVHESLLITKISPLNLNLAFTLLKYPASRELYAEDTPQGGKVVKAPEIPQEIRTAARVSIEVEWQENGKPRRMPINEWIQHGVTAKTMAAGPWVYGASESFEGKYVPETSGDIAAIFLSNAAILNYPGEDNGNDDVWTPFPKRLPEEGSAVTVIISPFHKPNPKP
ncbi:MAG: YdjY domain-containing protein [Verrucomicrobiota bacterium]